MRPLNRRRLAAGLALGALGGLGAVALPARAQATPRPWPKGQATPPLSLPSHEGPPWSLAAARGTPVLLNFWASWCEPCRSEMPSLELLAERNEAQGLQVIAVNFRETDAAIRRYLNQWPITLPILRDADGAAARAFGVRIFPSTIAIGRDGKALFTVVGEADWTGSEARRWVAPLLKP